jgi:hypothetical protein
MENQQEYIDDLKGSIKDLGKKVSELTGENIALKDENENLKAILLQQSEALEKLSNDLKQYKN